LTDNRVHDKEEENFHVKAQVAKVFATHCVGLRLFMELSLYHSLGGILVKVTFFFSFRCQGSKAFFLASQHARNKKKSFFSPKIHHRLHVLLGTLGG
jgi:hypothetical protein